MKKIVFAIAIIIAITSLSLTKAQGIFDDKDHKNKKETKESEKSGKKREKENEKDDDMDDHKESKEKSEKKTKATSDREGCFDESTHILNFGLGFGGSTYYSAFSGRGYSYRVSPAISVSYEQAYPKKLGPGYLGLGAYVGYQSFSSTYSYYYDDNGYEGNYYYKNNWKNFMIAARGAYHWDVLNFKKAEVYAGVLVGFRIQTYNYESNNPDPRSPNYELNSGSIFPIYSVFAGARWYFVPKVGLFAEAGYGISYLTGGFSFKF